MSDKITVVIGYKTERPSNWDSMSVNDRFNSDYKAFSFHRSGFWKSEKLSAIAKKLGFVGKINITHTRIDRSGKGRTYDEHKFSCNV